MLFQLTLGKLARRVRIAACETITVFNTGAASKAVVMNLCRVTPGVQTMRALRKQDRVRIQTAAKKVSLKYREKRQKLRSLRKSKGDKSAYQPGAFGLSSKPIDTGVSKKRKNRQRDKKTMNKVQKLDLSCLPLKSLARNDESNILLLIIIYIRKYL